MVCNSTIFQLFRIFIAFPENAKDIKSAPCAENRIYRTELHALMVRRL